MNDSPTPPLPQQADWRTAVAEALVAGTLKWNPLYGTTFSLDGKCPHCSHPQFSCVYALDVYRTALQRDTAMVSGEADLVELPVECGGQGCGSAHGPDATPCGAGRGYLIKVRAPDGFRS